MNWHVLQRRWNLTQSQKQKLKKTTHWGQSFPKCVPWCLSLWNTNCWTMAATKEGLCRTWGGNTHHTSSSCWSYLSPWTRACHTSSTSTESGHGRKTSSRGGEEGCRNWGRGILLYTSTRRHGSITLKQWQWNDHESNTWMQNSELSRSSKQLLWTSHLSQFTTIFCITWGVKFCCLASISYSPLAHNILHKYPQKQTLVAWCLVNLVARQRDFHFQYCDQEMSQKASTSFSDAIATATNDNSWTVCRTVNTFPITVSLWKER